MKPLHLEKIKVAVNKYKYIFGIAAIGIFLLLLPAGTEKKETKTEEEATFDRLALQEEMERVLSEIEGVGKLHLMLTVDATEEKELAENSKISEDGEADRKTESETTVVTVHTGSNQESVVVKRNLFPDYIGALVVCEGGGSAAVRLRVTEAVQALTGLPVKNISVIKGKT